MRFFGSKLLSAALLLCLGCAGSKPTNTTPQQLSAEDARLFEQGVDFIAKLDGLDGRWRDEWDRDLHQRVAASDLVAVVTVRTLRTDTDPEKRVTHRIVAHVDRPILGTPPSEEIELPVREGAAGFASVDQAAPRLPEQQFVAYVKWLMGEAGRPVAYFHLSPASEPVVAMTEASATQLSPDKPGDRVIVHTH